jgi:hypothetical protein
MKHGIEMGSGAMIYIPAFIEIGSVIGRGETQHGDLISLLSFFQNKEVRLKTILEINSCDSICVDRSRCESDSSFAVCYK